MDIEIIGTITNILPKVTGTSQKGDWSKQEYVINVEGENEQYPRSICFQIFGEEKINTAALRLNERVRVHLDIDCHEYNEKFYNQISCWRVDRNNEQQANQGLFSSQAPQQFSPQANNQRTPQRGNAQQQTEESSNDLPF
jgi:hypothetical protein